MENIIRSYYKIISNKYVVAFITLSFFLSIPFFFIFNMKVGFFMFIPVAFFTLAQLGIMFGATALLILSKEKRAKLKNYQFNKDSQITIKEFSQMFNIRPHTAYAIVSLMERSGYMEIRYLKDGKLLDLRPQKDFYTMVLVHRDR